MTAAQIEKQRIRDEVSASRRSRDHASREEAAERICAQLTDLAIRGQWRRVLAYISTPTEPGTAPFLRWAAGQGIEVLVPIAQPDRSMRWAPFVEGKTRTGLHGLTEPAEHGVTTASLAADDGAGQRPLDHAIIPACAATRAGARLGWGLGYYDRALPLLSCPTSALLFASEVRASVPTASHDARVAQIITPEATISCSLD